MAQRLIDSNVFSKRLMELWDNAESYGREDVIDVIAKYITPCLIGTPTVDPVKHGKWENVGHVYHRCSVCKQDIHSYTALNAYFCPNCGADMRGE